MRTAILFIFVTIFAFCYSRCNTCTENEDCEDCPDGQEGICDEQANECHCRDESNIYCSVKHECIDECGSNYAYCNSGQCYCDGKCRRRKKTNVIKHAKRIATKTFQRSFTNEFGKTKKTGYRTEDYYDSRNPKQSYSIKKNLGDPKDSFDSDFFKKHSTKNFFDD